MQIDGTRMVVGAVGRNYTASTRKNPKSLDTPIRIAEKDSFVISPEAQQLRTRAEIISQTIGREDTSQWVADTTYAALRGRVALERGMVANSQDPVGSLVEDVVNHVVGDLFDRFRTEHPNAGQADLDAFRQELDRVLDEGFAAARELLTVDGELPPDLADALDTASERVDHRLDAFLEQVRPD